MEWEAKQFASESALLQRVKHANLVRLFAFSIDGPHRCLVLELCTGGALDNRLACRATGVQAPPAPLPWKHRVQIAREVALALVHLHSLEPAMVHRDLKVGSAQPAVKSTHSSTTHLASLPCVVSFFSTAVDGERPAGRSRACESC